MSRVLISLGVLGLFFILMFTASPIESIAELLIVGIIPASSLQVSADTILLSYAIVLTLVLTSFAYNLTQVVRRRSTPVASTKLKKEKTPSTLPKHRYTHAKSGSSLAA